MVQAEIISPQVLVLDETDGHIHTLSIREGVEAAGGHIIPFDDLSLAIEELEEGVNAVIGTLTTDHLRGFKRLSELAINPLVEKTHALGVPMALVTAYPDIGTYLLQRHNQSGLFSGRDKEQLSHNVSDWLHRVWYGSEADSSVPLPVIATSDDVGPVPLPVKRIFGSDPKVRVGKWAATVLAENDQFDPRQLARAIGSAPASLKGFLPIFCKLKMVQETPEGYYRKMDSPLWSIFATTAEIIEKDMSVAPQVGLNAATGADLESPLTVEVGQGLFRGYPRLKAGIWIARRTVGEDGQFHLSQIRRELGPLAGSAENTVHMLASQKMLEYVANIEPSHRRYYQKTNSPYWRIFEATDAAIHALELSKTR